jgi:hypothetical protein
VAADIGISPSGGDLPANTETVTLALLASTNYTITNPAGATVTLLDQPLHAWQRANFTPIQLTNSQISGNNATPANDGLPNLVK